jgi:hypothetical protein
MLAGCAGVEGLAPLLYTIWLEWLTRASLMVQ